MATHENTNPNPGLAKDTNIITWLSKDLIYLILSRLPVKALLQLKLVSKSWLSLISSPDFVKTHHFKSNNDPDFTHHHLIVTYKQPADFGLYEFRSLSLYSLLNEPKPATTETIMHGYLNTDFMDEVVGCCDGLICLITYYDEDVILWNPSTRESRTLPKLDLPNYDYDSRSSYYGFCYDEYSDDFKVFCIFGLDQHECEVSVYSSKINCWRRIGDFPYLNGVHGKGKYAHGAIHWVSGENNLIVSLDIRTETYREVLPPKYGDVDSWTLGTLGKNLSVCTFRNTHFDLWVMKRCGAKDPWSKLFTIPCINTLSDCSNFKLIDICVNGDIIMMSNKHLQLYNSKDKTFKNLFDTGKGYFNSEYCIVYTYAESLVSLSPHF